LGEDEFESDRSQRFPTLLRISDPRRELNGASNASRASRPLSSTPPPEVERVSLWQIRMERSYFRSYKELKSFHKDAKAEAAAEARANTKAEEAAKSEDAKKPEPRKPVLYWTDLETGEPVLAPGFTEDGPIDYRKPENRGPDYGK